MFCFMSSLANGISSYLFVISRPSLSHQSFGDSDSEVIARDGFKRRLIPSLTYPVFGIRLQVLDQDLITFAP